MLTVLIVQWNLSVTSAQENPRHAVEYNIYGPFMEFGSLYSVEDLQEHNKTILAYIQAELPRPETFEYRYIECVWTEY